MEIHLKKMMTIFMKMAQNLIKKPMNTTRPLIKKTTMITKKNVTFKIRKCFRKIKLILMNRK